MDRININMQTLKSKSNAFRYITSQPKRNFYSMWSFRRFPKMIDKENWHYVIITGVASGILLYQTRNYLQQFYQNQSDQLSARTQLDKRIVLMQLGITGAYAVSFLAYRLNFMPKAHFLFELSAVIMAAKIFNHHKKKKDAQLVDYSQQMFWGYVICQGIIQRQFMARFRWSPSFFFLCLHLGLTYALLSNLITPTQQGAILLTLSVMTRQTYAVFNALVWNYDLKEMLSRKGDSAMSEDDSSMYRDCMIGMTDYFNVVHRFLAGALSGQFEVEITFNKDSKENSKKEEKKPKEVNKQKAGDDLQVEKTLEEPTVDIIADKS
ncbi:hypothetical protein FGO68_gene783 [Halteria grandinella]|uniref:Uncharacterized protein n=1 Tax=Halteria grandinella TaxID=5974 RepID=A0A8J8NKR3_HALGN|nr:hypothetical protein FGO68_gene783 [Halteria grandinella]